ncbi:hypothetical protein [Corynebacterium guangdongense]|uniref:Transcriptional regulator, AbiEi antitoxin, Type IV TA system n=1 Tax=Corynebacterium guangdongense TaxID=1783348 RepID=A0ABU2A0J7_9CORY|nr:hypothetical protein [Corynebacterium guangdongense]MDR7330713.1 hypothetical protein [Corynebacterium guangdongense]WJZ16728.1 hypothetical protein CGUA_00595 [Corynebacterium guangdongense]
MSHDDITAHFVDLRRLTNADHILRAAIAAGHYHRLTPEIAMLRERFTELPPWDRVRARTLAFGWSADRAVLVSRSAAVIHGLWTLGLDPLVELAYLTRSAPPRSQRHPYVVYRRSHLHGHEVIDMEGVRVSTVARTLRDVARYHGVIAGVVAIDSARRRFPALPLDGLTMGKFFGIGMVRQALELSTGLAESPLESEATALLKLDAEIGRHSIVPQQEVTIGGRRVRPDNLIDGWLIVEIDGELKYDGHTFGKPTDDVIRAERQREKLLQNAGYVERRYGSRDIRGGLMLADVRRTLRSAPSWAKTTG